MISGHDSGRRRRRGCYIHPHEILLETDLVVTVSGSGGAEIPVTVTLTQEKIILTSRRTGSKLTSCFSNNSEVWEIVSSDIVSVRPPHNGDSNMFGKKRRSLWPVFLIVAYPREGKGNVRKKKSYFFQLGGRSASRRDEVVQLSQVWVEAVSEICLGHRMCHLRPPSQPLLVLINPASGKGLAMRRWQLASSVLAEAGRVYEVIVTEGPGHASQILSSLDLAAWAGVVAVSGDGLVHEVFNGLLARPDWRLALQFSVGVIPGGSGNALVHTLAAAQEDRVEEDGGLMSSAVSIARGHASPLDLFLVRGPGTDVRVGFISLGWGLITDVDIDSEVIRCMGSVRFTIYGLLRVAQHKSYRGTISYVLADWPDRRSTTVQVPIHPLDSEESDWTNSSLGPDPGLIPGYPPHLASQPPLRHLATYADSWQELDQRLCTVNFVTGGPMYAPMLNGGHSVDRRLSPQRQYSKNSQHRRSSSYSNRESPSRSRSSSSPEKSKSSRSSRSRSVSSPEKTRRNKSTSNGIKRKLKAAPDTPLSATPTCIPPIAPPPVYPHGGRGPSPSCDPSMNPITATPLHKDWVSETSDYLAVMVLNVPYLNREFYGAPDCRHDDGVLWLMMIRQNVSRLSLMQLMLSLENGEHVNITGVDIFPVTAVKISVSISVTSFTRSIAS